MISKINLLSVRNIIKLLHLLAAVYKVHVRQQWNDSPKTADSIEMGLLAGLW